MEEQKYFMWYDNDDYRGGPFFGPHYTGDVELIGKKLFHSLDDLLKTKATFSESTKKRLMSAKPGTKIKAHYLHSSGDLMVKRISEKEVNLLLQLEKSYDNMQELEKELNKIKLKAEDIIKKLGFKNEY